MKPLCKLLFWGLLGLHLAIATQVQGQSVPYRELEQKVYRLNNQLNYKDSQALLLPVLQSDRYNADEKYQASILLSYIYKRVSDYQSTLKFLGMARQFAGKTAQRDSCYATIDAQEAFVYFDTRAYSRADSLMIQLEKAGFRYIDLEDKSKLVMQQGYLQFLNKEYKAAENTYSKAIQWMKASAPCHLPMIYVKKMQLYDAMGQQRLSQQAFQQSIHHADSCGIIKYNIYAYEELLKIYESHNNLPQIVATKKKLDTLNVKYANEANLAALHNQQETILDHAQEKHRTTQEQLIVILTALALLSAGLSGWLLITRKKSRKVEQEFRQIKAELEQYIAANRLLSQQQRKIEEPYLNGLSDRQREIVTYLAEGLSNREMAERLFVSENTIKYHIKNIYQQLEIKSRKELLINYRK